MNELNPINCIRAKAGNRNLIAISKVGRDEDKGIDFWIVLSSKTYQEINYIDLRYFSFDSKGEGEWMSNGITLRDSIDMRTSLKKMIGML